MNGLISILFLPTILESDFRDSQLLKSPAVDPLLPVDPYAITTIGLVPPRVYSCLFYLMDRYRVYLKNMRCLVNVLLREEERRLSIVTRLK